MKMMGENADPNALAFMALGNSSIDVLDLFLARGWDINKKMKINDGAIMTPLHIEASISNGNLETVKWLIGNGAEIDARGDPSNQTPMHEAACHGKVDIIRYLKERGADLYARTSQGDQTPMHWAINSNQTESIKCLKELGFDVNTKGSDSNTPMYWAALFGKIESIKCLAALQSITLSLFCWKPQMFPGCFLLVLPLLLALVLAY